MIHRILALVADCDDTLAPDTTAQLLEAFGVSAQQFYKDRVTRLVNDSWDPPLATMHEILALVAEGPLAELTRDRLIELGKGLTLYPGVPDVFDNLRAEIEGDSRYKEHGIKLEYYVITGGLEDLVRASPLGSAVNQVWGCNFAYDDQGRIRFPQRAVSFTEKTRFLFNIEKGFVGDKYKNQPYIVNVHMTEDDLRVPFHNMVYLGDGPSDIPCMSVLREKGYVIGVLCQDDGSRAYALGYGRRVNLTVPQDYSKGSDAYRALAKALREKAEGILRRIEFQEANRPAAGF